MVLKLTNTLGGRLEPFEPIEPGHVRMYTCGLTVYNRGHVGNFRTFVSQDILRRYLQFKGYRVTQVTNFTDVDDKTIEGANAAGVPLREYTQKFIDYFYEDCDTLGIQRAEHYPRATDPEYIDAMIELVQKLEQRGHTYRSNGSVYFKVDSLADYGKLSRIDVAGMKAGARVDSDDYSKENLRDFVLWKAPRDGEPFWDAPMGPGRPGWHLECSAMGMKLLGETFDLHAGGVDLIFPHHENEIAQSEGATGKPFVRHWMHTEFLLVEGEKMSKSKGNQYTVRELVDEGFSPMAIRYLLLSVYYRQQLNFTREGLRQAETAIRRVDDFLDRLSEVMRPGDASEASREAARSALERFEAAMDDDLNTSAALAVLFDLVKGGNTALSSSTMTKGDADAFRGAIERMNTVLGVFGQGEKVVLDQEVEKLIAARNEARATRDYARADAIRGELDSRGIVLEDTSAGTRWRRK
ncbi:MAG TPA: cysteine--tRNA ligase [Vicinamibacteria bacterium]|nr:cysteine--tRNA ligase [Vicinamibacteria bacterium]